MTKKLLLTAMLMVPGLAYAGNPSATLSGQIVSVGSGPTLPAPAAAAGFTTLALNADFSQPFYATRSNWLDCAGAATPQWWRGVSGWGANVDGPCNAILVENDPTINKQVLHFLWQDSYYSGVVRPHIIGIQTGNLYSGDPPTQHTLPPFAYVEVVARYDASTNNTAYTSWSAGAGVEWDGIEINGTGSDIAYHNNFAGTSSYLTANPPMQGRDQTTYHTYAWRVTSDGSTDAVMCGWIDGKPYEPPAQTCTSWQPTAAQIAGGSLENILLQIGSQGSCVAPCANGHPVNGWIQSVKVWSCAGFDSGQKCFSSSPNP